MHKLNGFGVLATIIGAAVFVDPGAADAQIDGAVQYPPPSVGEDAQPPPPARPFAVRVRPPFAPSPVVARSRRCPMPSAEHGRSDKSDKIYTSIPCPT